jgi:hypothetical protein
MMIAHDERGPATQVEAAPPEGWRLAREGRVETLAAIQRSRSAIQMLGSAHGAHKAAARRRRAERNVGDSRRGGARRHRVQPRWHGGTPMLCAATECRRTDRSDAELTGTFNSMTRVELLDHFSCRELRRGVARIIAEVVPPPIALEALKRSSDSWLDHRSRRARRFGGHFQES